MRQIGESYSTSSHMLHPTLVTMPRSENIQHLLELAFPRQSPPTADLLKQSSHQSGIAMKSWRRTDPVNNLEFLVSGNSHWLQLCNIKKRSKFTSQEHHKNSQNLSKIPPIVPTSLKKHSPGPGKTPWKVEVWASHPDGKLIPKR